MADDSDDLIGALCAFAARVMEDASALAAGVSPLDRGERLKFLRSSADDVTTLLAAAEVVHHRAVPIPGEQRLRTDR